MNRELEGEGQKTLQNHDDAEPRQAKLPYVLVGRYGQQLEESGGAVHRGHQTYFYDHRLDDGEQETVAEVRDDQVGLESAKEGLLAVHAQVETRQEDVGGESHHRDVEVGVEHAESLRVRALGRPIEVILLELNFLLGLLELQEREENEK